MPVAPTPMAFAAPAHRHLNIRVIPLPAGPVEVRWGLVAHYGSVIAIELEGKVLLARWPRRKSTDDPAVSEQLVGWCVAKDYRVIRVTGWRPRARALSAFHAPGLFARCKIHWARLFLAELAAQIKTDLPRNVLVPDHTRDVWRTGAGFWRNAGWLLDGLAKTDTELVVEVLRDLTTVARAWEYRMARLENRARTEAWLEPEDLDLISICDQRMRDCMRYVPDYQMLPSTVARLL